MAPTVSGSDGACSVAAILPQDREDLRSRGATGANSNREPEEPAVGRLEPTPLPRVQLGILLYLQLPEPVTSFVVFPFINQLILDYGLTGGDENNVGYYAGAIISGHYAAEMAFVFFWGRLSDRIGRRPVILLGLVGLAVAILAFGLLRTFAGLILSRCLAGALNGNIGVMKSMMAELTDESNQARAFGLVPLVFSVGMTLAPLIGGSLAHPYERFPSVFGKWTFWQNYPYFLPCLVASMFPISAFLLAVSLMMETMQGRAEPVRNATYGTITASATPHGASGGTPSSSQTPLVGNNRLTPPPLRSILTTRVRVAVLNYSTIAFLSIMFTFVQPLYLSTPISSGGLGLSPPTIGLILGFAGFWNGLFSALFFARLHKRLGTKELFTLSISTYVLLYTAWPVMGLLARRNGKVSMPVIVLLAAQQFTAPLSRAGYSCSNIFLISAAPSRLALGATVGLGQTVASFMRAAGPAISASLFAATLEKNLMGGYLVYFVLVLLVLLALGCASLLPTVVKRSSEDPD